MNMHSIRLPAVAGQFYPASAKELKAQIGSFVDKKAQKSDYLGCILPHAGYIYSGEVAVKTLSRVNLKNRIILLGPNHTGFGVPFSIMTEGVWQTPLGEVPIDSGLAEKISAGSRFLESDTQAHIYEHSLEVELPLLQFFKVSFTIVPIIFSSDDMAALRSVGEAIAAAVKETDGATLIASSDMTHYEPGERAAKKDRLAIDAMLQLDEEKLMAIIKKEHISMCGYAPVICLLSAAKSLGAKKAELVDYRNSGDITGDKTSVVGYAGLTLR